MDECPFRQAKPHERSFFDIIGGSNKSISRHERIELTLITDLDQFRRALASNDQLLRPSQVLSELLSIWECASLPGMFRVCRRCLLQPWKRVEASRTDLETSHGRDPLSLPAVEAVTRRYI